MEFDKTLSVKSTGIEGLVLVELPVHRDARGWFKENWQVAKLSALGVPKLHAVQNNISYNERRGVTRGIHAEPWNKWVSVAKGSVFGAWVDLREGSESFGRVFTAVLDATRAIYIPRGVGNAFQALEDEVIYTYLVDAHWSSELKKSYTYVNLSDPNLDIQWPIPLSQAIVSDADATHPLLKDVRPMPPLRILVTGCYGQLGRAVKSLTQELGLDNFDFCDMDSFDIADPDAYGAYDWTAYQAIINCGAWTAVDKAETPEGRLAAWRANAVGPALLARICSRYGLTLVHISSDYVFDGIREIHSEDEPMSPLSVYGQSKAAGDLAVAGTECHYILRSSWVIGEGKNFVKTMAALSRRCVDPADTLTEVSVVDDQIGRLTFAGEMARSILHLLQTGAPFGTYNLTNEGPSVSWAEIARRVFDAICGNASAVKPLTSAEYYGQAAEPIAPRPSFSTLDLRKIESTGFIPYSWEDELVAYVSRI